MPGSGFPVAGSGFRVLGTGFRVLRSSFRVSRTGFRVPVLRLWDSGFRFRVSGLGVQVPATTLSGSASRNHSGMSEQLREALRYLVQVVSPGRSSAIASVLRSINTHAVISSNHEIADL